MLLKNQNYQYKDSFLFWQERRKNVKDKKVSKIGEIMTVGEINVTLQLFGSVLSLMIIFCLFIGGNAKTKTGRMYVLLLLLNMGGLLFDALAYMFRGKIYPFAYFGVRASNFLAF